MRTRQVPQDMARAMACHPMTTGVLEEIAHQKGLRGTSRPAQEEEDMEGRRAWEMHLGQFGAEEQV